jgi:hypothetical protein
MAFLGATPLRSRAVHTFVVVVGLAALLFAWLGVLDRSELKPVTFASSIPFLSMAGALAVRIMGSRAFFISL